MKPADAQKASVLSLSSLCIGLCGLLAASLAACDHGQSAESERASGGHGARPDCVGCHIDDYQGAHRHVNVRPKTCGVCHREDHWHPTILKHDWPLTGAHEKANCFACHSAKPPVFEGTARACVGCHRSDFDAENIKLPSHARAALACEECHSTNAWSEWPGHPSASRAPTPTTGTPPVLTSAPTPNPTTPVKATAKPPTTVKPPTTGKPPTTVTAPTPTTPPPDPTTKPHVITGASRR